MFANQLSERLGKDLANEFKQNGFRCVRSSSNGYYVYKSHVGKIVVVPKRVNDRKIYRRILREAGL